MITQRAVDVVKEMLPKEGRVAVEWDSAAYHDILNEHATETCSQSRLDAEVTEILVELGRGQFSVLDSTDD